MQVFPGFITEAANTVQRKLNPKSNGFNDVFRSLSTVAEGNNVAPDSLSASPFLPEEAKNRKNALFTSLPASPDTLKELQEDLKDIGISEETLESLMQQAASENGISWNQLLQKLQQDLTSFGKAEAAEFDGATRNSFQSFLQKLGFLDREVTQLTEKAEQGDIYGTWRAIATKLDQLPKEALLSIDSNELQSIGKIMRLSSDGMSRLMSVMKDSQGVISSPSAMKQALSEINSAVSKIQDGIDEKIDQLRDIIQPAMNAALEAEVKSVQADNRQTRSTSNKLLLMRDSVHTRIAEKLEENPAATANASDPAHVTDEMRNRIPANNKADSSAQRNSLEAAAIERKSGKNPEEKSFTGHDQEHKESKDAAKELLEHASPHKSEQRIAAENLVNRAESRIAAPLLPGMYQTQDESPAMPQQAAETARSERSMHQVEKGMLETLNNGQRRLTLRLDPPELGRIAVTLTVVNKEVTAIIRPESPEAVKAVNDQLHQLRLNLEQQGLKVERLEVQQQLQNNFSSPSWQGTDQHNSAREQQQWFQREQRMAAIRREGTELAQEMHSPEHKARITTSSVDIIA
ncbi:flagellar hook-length control protein FliK [Oleidesulfovibrio sp.]|uniref:flagellar hook-length control protein FliK n=1 Tax=Oleidesulfovibrio sp. TaxID=2909707 RepID=UPI003A890150